jgi:YVTN family beta-propeller protein
VGAQPFGIAVSPDGREVCVTNNAGASISTINVATNSVINTISTQAFPGGIAIYSKPAQPIISPNVVSFIATPSESNNAPFIVYFNGSTTQGDAANMHWDFGDGRTIDSIHKDATVANSYNLAGSYTVKLTVTYRDASTNNTSQSISVAAVPHKPINADFVGAPLSGIASLNVQFTDNSTGADNWFYVFGDNGSAIAKNPAHIYKTPGSYSVAQIAFNTTTSLYDAIVKKGYVNVADANGTVPQTPNNIINAPISDIVINDFTANVTSGSAPLNVAFTSNVSGLANVRTWTWIFEPVGNDYYSTSINTAIHTRLNA